MSNAPERWEANSREIHRIEFLAGLDCQLRGGESALEPRLRRIPGAWQKYRTAMTFIEHVLDGVYGSLPVKTVRHMANLCERGEIVIRPKQIGAKVDSVQIVPTEEIKLIVNKAMEANCAICMNEGKAIKKCELRKALMLICPPTNPETGALCPYADVAAQNALGDYI